MFTVDVCRKRSRTMVFISMDTSEDYIHKEKGYDYLVQRLRQVKVLFKFAKRKTVRNLWPKKLG